MRKSQTVGILLIEDDTFFESVVPFTGDRPLELVSGGELHAVDRGVISAADDHVDSASWRCQLWQALMFTSSSEVGSSLNV